MPHLIARDGARIAYEERGAGRPIVLLHGLMANRGFFHAQRELARDFRLILVDLRGHGDSPVDGQCANVELLADDVALLAERLDLRAAIGIGWSLGAAVLWQLLSGPASDRFAGSVVVDMTARVMNGSDWTLGLPPETCAARSEAIAADFPTFAAGAGAAIFADGADEMGQWAATEFARNDPPAIGAIWQSLTKHDFRPLLPSIRQPTLIVHGARSHLYGPETADFLTGALPDARALCFERSGHAPHLEQPELFNQTIRDFAARLPQPHQTHATA